MGSHRVGHDWNDSAVAAAAWVTNESSILVFFFKLFPKCICCLSHVERFYKKNCMSCSLYSFNLQCTSSLHHKMCLNMVLYHYLFDNFPCWMFKSLKSCLYYKWCCEGHLYVSTFAYISDSFLSIDSWRWNCSFKEDICKVLMHVFELVSRRIAGVSPTLHTFLVRNVTVKNPFWC